MTHVTVRELAETVGAPIDRLLKQMQEAGLPHTGHEDAVSEEQKQALLAHLKRSHGESSSAPSKITLKRKSVGTIKATGQGRGRTVAVEVRKKRTYVKRGEAPDQGREAEQDVETPRAVVSQAEMEAERIRHEELARKSAEEEGRRREAERKAEDERRRAEAERKKEEERVAKEREAAIAARAAKPAAPDVASQQAAVTRTEK